MSMHHFTTSLFGDAPNHRQSVVEGVRAHEGHKSRGPNAKMDELLRKVTGRKEFNVTNIEASVSVKLAEHQIKL